MQKGCRKTAILFHVMQIGCREDTTYFYIIIYVPKDAGDAIWMEQVCRQFHTECKVCIVDARQTASCFSILLYHVICYRRYVTGTYLAQDGCLQAKKISIITLMTEWRHFNQHNRHTHYVHHPDKSLHKLVKTQMMITMEVLREVLRYGVYPANTIYGPNVALMLVNHLIFQPKINPTLFKVVCMMIVLSDLIDQS